MTMAETIISEHGARSLPYRTASHEVDHSGTTRKQSTAMHNQFGAASTEPNRLGDTASPVLVQGPEGRAQADQRQVRNGAEAAYVP
jgi:hypothetical protein